MLLQTLNFALVFAFLSKAKSQATGIPADCARNYTIGLGDVCDTISAQQNVSSYQLAVVNSGVINPECSNLVLGQTICLGLTGHDCDKVTTVKSGDNCYTVSNAAGITYTTLLSNNPNINAGCSNLYLGEVLCVASTPFIYNQTLTNVTSVP